MSRKSSATVTSKVSASSALTKTPNANKPSILKSAFAPSYLQLHLFASVIQSFNSQLLRIHDTTNNHLRQQHSIQHGTNITCLDWGYYGPGYREGRSSSKKKRKRDGSAQENVVVAYGTSQAEICMYSPTEGKLVGTLKGGHEKDIRDFKFLEHDGLQAWSIGGDGKLVHWDLMNDRPVRTISIPDVNVRILCAPSTYNPQMICGSYKPYAVDLESEDDFRIESYHAFKNQLHTLIRSGKDSTEMDETFLGSDGDRYVHVYDIRTKEIVKTLVANAEVDQLELYSSNIDAKNALHDQTLAVVRRDGLVDLFYQPFVIPSTVNAGSRKKNYTQKPPASIRMVFKGGLNAQAHIFGAHFSGPDIILATVDGGVEPHFQKMRWQDEGSAGLLFENVREVVRTKEASVLNSVALNGVKNMGQMNLDSSRTVVVNGGAEPIVAPADTVDLLSSDGEDEEMNQDTEQTKVASELVVDEDSDASMHDEQEREETDEALDAQSQEEMSFGEQLAARNKNTISIMDALPLDQGEVAVISKSNPAVLPSGMSLGTVLTQALRTNDQSLLETCLHVTEETVIQNTILRLDSSLAANLLTKLAERLADRPGRYGHLLTWVQSTMIAHGGAIAAQTAVAAKLKTLYAVLSDRSRILPTILLLKGKLDMLNAQQSFRAQAKVARGGLVTDRDAPATIYIEGEPDNWSSDDAEDLDETSTNTRPSKKLKTKKRAKNLEDLIAADDKDSASESEEDMPMTNGIDAGSEDSSSDDTPHVNRPNGILDDEAEVSGASDDEEGESVSSDEDEDEEEDEGDSEMDDFINDGEISVEEEDDVDAAIEEAEKTRTRKSK